MNNIDMSWLQDFDPAAELAAGNVNTGDYTPLPDGDYDFEIRKIEPTNLDNDRATGMLLRLELAVAGDEFANRRIFDRVIITYTAKPGGDADKAAKAQQIGRAKFASICMAAGVTKAPQDLDVLIGKFVRAKVITREYNGKRDNEIKGVFQAPKAVANPTRPAPMAASASPWAR